MPLEQIRWCSFLALSPHSKKVLGQLGPLFMEFVCSSSACVGFLQML